VGPAASRLWLVDVDLHRLTNERASLIRALRAGIAGGDAAPGAPPAAPSYLPYAAGSPLTGAGAPYPTASAPAGAPRAPSVSGHPSGTGPTGASWASSPPEQWAGTAQDGWAAFGPAGSPFAPPVPDHGTAWAGAAGPGRPRGWAGPPGAAGGRWSELGGEPGRPPLSAQTVLLGLGAFSLIVAAVVFLAVTWRDLSTVGKALTLVGITTVFGVATAAVRRRSLTATAEALAAVTVMLGLADAYAVRVGLAADADGFVVWGIALGVLAVLDAGFAVVSKTAVPRLAASVLAQLCLPVLALAGTASPARFGAVLLGQALVVAAVLRWHAGRPERYLSPDVLRAGAAFAWVVGTGCAATVALTGSSGRPVAAILLVVAGATAAAIAWWQPEDDGLRPVGAGVATAAALAAAATIGGGSIDGDALALAVAGLAVAVVLVAARLDRSWEQGPLLVAALAALAVSVPSWPELLATVDAPWSALGATGAWQFALDRPVRGVASFAGAYDSQFVTALGFLVVLAVGALGVRHRPDARRWADALLAIVVGAAASAVPFALDAPVWTSALLLLATMATATGAVLWWAAHGRPSLELTPWWVLIVAAGGQGLVWSLLTPGLTLTALVVVAATAAAVVAWGLRRSDPTAAAWGALACSIATALVVPVVASAVDAPPGGGWAALGVIAALAAAGGFALWASTDEPAVRSATGLGGLVASGAYVAAMVGTGSFVDRAPGAAGLALVLGTGSGAAAGVAVALARRDDAKPVLATAVATLLGVGAVAMAAVQADFGPSAVWLVVMLASAAAALVALVAEARSVRADLVDAIDLGAGLWGALGLVVLASVGSSSRVSVGLVLAALTLGVTATRPSRRWVASLAALAVLVLVWQRLAVAGVSTAEAFTLPAAALLAGLGAWIHHRSPHESSWTTWGPALIVGLGPSVVLSLADPGLFRPLGTVIAATVVVLAGSHLRRQAPLTIGAVALTVLGVEQLGPFVSQLPRWVTFATVGVVLLLVGAGYERRRAQLAGLRAQYRDLH
jgi:hypothetical protein